MNKFGNKINFLQKGFIIFSPGYIYYTRRMTLDADTVSNDLAGTSGEDMHSLGGKFA
jgi:hypothetical protein